MMRVIAYPRAAAANASAMPVVPLVGSISSLPGRSTPRFSASQIIDAPMRSFTEYAGLRPSIFARMVARAPSVTRLSFTSGVRPMLSELSLCSIKSPNASLRSRLCYASNRNGGARVSKRSQSNLPIRHVLGLPVAPVANQFGETGAVDHARDGFIRAPPGFRERIAGRLPASALVALGAFDKTQHLAHRARIRRPSQQIPAFRAAPRLHEATLLQPCKNQLQEFLRDLLSPGDLGDPHWLATLLQGEIEDRMQRVFARHRDIPARNLNLLSPTT